MAISSIYPLADRGAMLVARDRSRDPPGPAATSRAGGSGGSGSWRCGQSSCYTGTVSRGQGGRGQQSGQEAGTDTGDIEAEQWLNPFRIGRPVTPVISQREPRPEPPRAEPARQVWHDAEPPRQIWHEAGPPDHGWSHPAQPPIPAQPIPAQPIQGQPIRPLPADGYGPHADGRGAGPAYGPDQGAGQGRWAAPGQWSGRDENRGHGPGPGAGPGPGPGPGFGPGPGPGNGYGLPGRRPRNSPGPAETAPRRDRPAPPAGHPDPAGYGPHQGYGGHDGYGPPSA